MNCFLPILCFFCVLSCFGQYNVEYQRGEALESKEFHELKLSYKKFLHFGKNNNAQTARKKYRDDKNLKDTMLRYSIVRDSLELDMKSKSTIFFSKFSLKSMNMTPAEMKAWLEK